MTEQSARSAPVYYLSHHKCATMYANAILRRVSAEIGVQQRTVYGPDDFGGDLGAFSRSEPVDLVCYLDADWDEVRDLEQLHGVHVVRDPRDILVSAYFSHLHSHQTSSWAALREHRRRLETVSKEEGLHLEIDFSGYVFRSMARWEYDCEGVLELQYETLARHPFEFWLRAVEHLGLLDDDDFGLRRNLGYAAKGLLRLGARKVGVRPTFLPPGRVPAQRLLGIVHENRFEKKSGGRDPGVADPTNHYRKGEPGDWRNHLSPDHVDRLLDEHPGLLEKSGYDGAGEA